MNNHFSLSVLGSVFCLTAACLLTGCTANFSVPDATATPLVKGSMGSIQGSNYGGHAPLVGAHVYLLEGTTNGYGGAAKSLLAAGETATDANFSTFTTAQDTTGSGSPTNGMYYITTDSHGDFDLSNGYTCDPGYPVYIYAQGGNPTTSPAVSITGASAAPDVNGKLLVTFTNSGTNLLYQGESINFSQFSPTTTSFEGEALTTQVVSPLNLTTSTFAVEFGPSSSSIGTQAFTGTVTQATPALSNPAVVNLAVLGVCPAGGPVVNLTGASSSQSGGNLLVTFTNSGNNSLTAGEQVTFGTIPSPYNPFSGTTQTVSAIGLSSSQFSVLLGPGTNQTTATFTSTATPLGNFSQLPFVFVNEVSTAAAAYALGGFFPAPGTTGLANAGAVAANLSIPASDTLALLGLQNAAITASQLYDIGGSNVGTGGDGDTHIARTTTPGVAVYGTTTAGSATMTVPSTVGLFAGTTITGSTLPAGETISAIGTNTITLSTGTGVTAGTNVKLYAGAGNGTVPQSLLNTVGNILANCVDSNNTYSPYTTVTGAVTSTQCSSLFSNALSAGTSGTAPIDTASAAIDIAHNPWANVTNLINVGPGNAPFQPTLSTTNDFSVGIKYTPTNVNNPEGLAIDGQGRVWYPNAGSGYVTTLTPFGGVQYNVSVAGGSPDYVAIDGNGNAWFDNKGNFSLQEISGAGAFVNTFQAGNITGNQGVSVDGANDMGYIYSGFQGTPGGYDKFSGTGALSPPTGGNPLTGSTGCMSQSTNAHTAIDNATNGYNLWVTGESPDDVCIVNTTTGALVHQITINATTGIPGSYQPEFPAIDVNGNAWIPNQGNASISKITQAGGLTSISSANLSGAFGAAVDGSGNIFVSNRTGNSITEFIPGSGTATAASTNYYGGGNATIFSDPLNMQVDPSGNLWVSNYLGNRIVELLGVAAPTWEPLSDAAYHNKLGSKP